VYLDCDFIHCNFDFNGIAERHIFLRYDRKKSIKTAFLRHISIRKYNLSFESKHIEFYVIYGLYYLALFNIFERKSIDSDRKFSIRAFIPSLSKHNNELTSGILLHSTI